MKQPSTMGVKVSDVDPDHSYNESPSAPNSRKSDRLASVSGVPLWTMTQGTSLMLSASKSKSPKSKVIGVPVHVVALAVTMEAGGREMPSAGAAVTGLWAAPRRRNDNATTPMVKPWRSRLGLQVNRAFIQMRNVQSGKLRRTGHAHRITPGEVVGVREQHVSSERGRFSSLRC